MRYAWSRTAVHGLGTLRVSFGLYFDFLLYPVFSTEVKGFSRLSNIEFLKRIGNKDTSGLIGMICRGY